MAIGIIAAAIVPDVRLLAGPAVELTDGDGKQFALIFGVDRNRQLTADFAQLCVAETHLGLGNAAVAIANTHVRIGGSPASPDEKQRQQAINPHQS